MLDNREHQSVMNCHYGYSEQHALYVVLHPALMLYVLIMAKSLPLLLCVSFCGCDTFNMAYHVLVIAVCSTEWVSQALPERY